MSGFYPSNFPPSDNAPSFASPGSCFENIDPLAKPYKSTESAPVKDEIKEPEPAPKSAPRNRRPSAADHIKHRRTRNGCYTCRGRRVKCDEQHPVCDRCKKGNRDCTYPEPRLSQKSPSTSRREKPQIPSQQDRSPSTESEVARTESLQALPIEQRPSPSCRGSTSTRSVLEDASPKQQSPSSLDHTWASVDALTFEECQSPSTDRSSVPSADLDNPRKYSSVSTEASQDSKLLPPDLQYYLDYHLNHINSRHYFFKHDADDFIRSLVLEYSLGYEPLLYAVVGFGAYHAAVQQANGKIQDFLGYYNKSVSLLRKSLASGQAHTDSTMLTILQLATFEDYLGDLVSLLGHQQAACRMLLELYTSKTIQETEVRRKIFDWYTRFDLSGGLMSGNETALGPEWWSAIATYYHEQSMIYPQNIDYKFEAAISKHRLMCAELALLFSKLTRKTITLAQFEVESRRFEDYIGTWRDNLDPVFHDERYLVFDFGGRKKDPDDIVDPYLPGGLSKGTLFDFNLMLMDWFAIVIMFQAKTASLRQQTPPADLGDLALELCRIIEAIEMWPETPPGGFLQAQASLAMACVFLPKDERCKMWCRRKLAKVESFGHVYPSAFRERMAAIWNIPEIEHWWLPHEENYPPMVRRIRSFLEDRLPQAPSRSRSEDQRTLKGIFSQLTIKDRSDISTPQVPAREEFPKHPSQPMDADMESEDSLLEQSRQSFWQRMGGRKLTI